MQIIRIDRSQINFPEEKGFPISIQTISIFLISFRVYASNAKCPSNVWSASHLVQSRKETKLFTWANFAY